MDKEKKNKIISAGVTAITMLLLMVFMICCGFTETIPPPPAKKAILIELDANVGGGGGGGTPVPQEKAKPSNSSTEPVATQNAVEAPSVSNTQKTTKQTAEDNSPKVNEDALFKPGRGGSGSGGGEGSGTGSGKGSGLGPGEGGGSGGGIGYGTGTRGVTHMPKQDVTEDGQVSVEVHVDENGNVIGARVINNSKHQTTITNSSIWKECIERAKTAKYVPGKEELRIIVFHK